MSDQNLPEPTNSQFLVYRDHSGNARLDVRFDGETVWLTQAQLVELFDSSKANISEHIKHIFEDGELPEAAVVRKFRTTAADGKSYVTTFYDLDMIISVGYRVKSKVATEFRIWATQHLVEFIRKGFIMDDERLENPDVPFDYFEELLARIQRIRTSEKRFYRKITDIYATSIDYDKDAEITKTFYATVQNKFHWAITGQTAAEVVRSRADMAKPNMGLTTWRGDVIQKSDVVVAKNYYNEDELRQLNNLVEQYLIFAQTQAERRIPMKMTDWVLRLDGFLTLNDREILTDAGRVSQELSSGFAQKQLEAYNQRIADEGVSDFDEFASRMIEREAEDES
jgi:hypothetical protein